MEQLLSDPAVREQAAAHVEALNGYYTVPDDCYCVSRTSRKRFQIEFGRVLTCFDASNGPWKAVRSGSRT